MFFDFDGFALMEMPTNKQHPQQGPGQHTQQQVQSLRMDQMGVFQIEASGFQKSKRGFNRPAHAIQSQDLLQVGAVGDEYNQFPLCGPMTDQVEDYIAIEDRVGIEAGFASGHALVKRSNIAQTAIVEGNPGVTTQADDKVDLVRQQKAKPGFVNSTSKCTFRSV